MGKCAFRDLDTHSKCSLLEGVTDILHACSARGRIFCRAHESGECEVHSLHCVRKRDVGTVLCELFNERPSRMREVVTAGKLIQRIAKTNIQRLAEDTVAAVQKS